MNFRRTFGIVGGLVCCAVQPAVASETDYQKPIVPTEISVGGTVAIVEMSDQITALGRCVNDWFFFRKDQENFEEWVEMVSVAVATETPISVWVAPHYPDRDNQPEVCHLILTALKLVKKNG